MASTAKGVATEALGEAQTIVKDLKRKGITVRFLTDWLASFVYLLTLLSCTRQGVIGGIFKGGGNG